MTAALGQGHEESDVSGEMVMAGEGERRRQEASRYLDRSTRYKHGMVAALALTDGDAVKRPCDLWAVT